MSLSLLFSPLRPLDLGILAVARARCGVEGAARAAVDLFARQGRTVRLLDVQNVFAKLTLLAPSPFPVALCSSLPVLLPQMTRCLRCDCLRRCLSAC